MGYINKVQKRLHVDNNDDDDREDGELEEESDSELTEYEIIQKRNIQECKRLWNDMMKAKVDASANVPVHKERPKKPKTQEQVTSEYCLRKDRQRNKKYIE